MPEKEDVPSEAASQEAPAKAPAGEAPSEGAPQESLPKADVYVLLQVSVMQFAALAWQKMGLRADPFTNQIEKDVDQARLAIDTVAALLDKLLPHLQGQQARDFQSMLTDLRLNFVKQAE
jgi:Domain of unknown function (DUF1844)